MKLASPPTRTSGCDFNLPGKITALVVSVFASNVSADPNQHLEMFLDDVNIASMSGLVRELQQPDRRPDPVINGAGPWDTRRSFGTVIFDEADDLYKAWYMINDNFNAIAYAVSTDGINWDYPDLGLVEYPESGTPSSTDNNILFRGLGHRKLYNTAVIKDDTDPDLNRRYKIAYYDHAQAEYVDGQSAGIFTGTSPDGIHWTRTTTPAAPELAVHRLTETSIHDVVEMMYDSQKGKYVLYTKSLDQSVSTNDHRIIVRTESSDFINWTTPQVVVEHENTTLDPQSYGSSVFEYEGVYVMPLRIYHNTGRADGEQGDRTIDIQLAASRDGINWTRVADKATFMPLGPDGAWDDGMIMPFRPFEKDGEIRLYYHGWNGPHENPDGSSVSRQSTIGLATLDAGRFVAITTDSGDPGDTGSLTTDAFVLQGDRLLINADPGDYGSIRVALLDANQNEISGYTDDLSTLISIDSLYYRIWYPGSTIGDLRNTSVSLRFDLTGDAKLYGYTTAGTTIIPEPTSGILIAGLFALQMRRCPPNSGAASRATRLRTNRGHSGFTKPRSETPNTLSTCQ